jgi:hypothetical protein
LKPGRLLRTSLILSPFVGLATEAKDACGGPFRSASTRDAGRAGRGESILACGGACDY